MVCFYMNTYFIDGRINDSLYILILNLNHDQKTNTIIMMVCNYCKETNSIINVDNVDI